jgi:hypothetical protein
VGESVRLKFEIAQHNRDSELLKTFAKYFECGNVYKHSENAVVFLVAQFLDITEKIIPFFDKYPIVGVKALDFSNFCEVAELMKNKAHLSQEGLDQIRQIKAGMNIGRKIYEGQ